MKTNCEYVQIKEISRLFGLSQIQIKRVLKPLYEKGKIDAYKEQLNKSFFRWMISKSDAERIFSEFKKDAFPIGHKKKLITKIIEDLKKEGKQINVKNVKERIKNISVTVPYIYILLRQMSYYPIEKKENFEMDIEKIESVVKFIKENFESTNKAISFFEKMDTLFSSVKEAKKYAELVELFRKSSQDDNKLSLQDDKSEDLNEDEDEDDE